MNICSFSRLSYSDLLIDAIYEGQPGGHISGEAISNLLPGVGNLGGFRASGDKRKRKYIVLYTSNEDKDWPDKINPNTGLFVYYGDNKTPGRELHDTPRQGNTILKQVFDSLHSSPPDLSKIPPFFVFSRHPTPNSSRSAQFKGLAVPGHPGIPATEDLVAVWKTTNNRRFQNYKALFTILDASRIDRKWIEDLRSGRAHTDNAPHAWRKWIETGKYTPLRSEPTTVVRSTDDQAPSSPLGADILEAVYEYFSGAPTSFEAFAARVFRMQDSRAIIDDITRGVVDGGRDATGRYRLGLESDPVYMEFSLEAKCYRPPLNGQSPVTVGVKDVARLIARIRHREFGVFVTTSIVGRQAYREVREDGHPIVFLCGKDIAETLVTIGYSSVELVRDFLNREYPKVLE